VERTGSWCNRFRALRVRWEVKAANDLALFHLACAPPRVTAFMKEQF